ncbi:hypothetical protein [Streptomyces qinglanensis]|uniref:hypothetical protein n=1 Tax=Streptomyces qinglanensis TaxID=943816 RepID=UPI003D715687
MSKRTFRPATFVAVGVAVSLGLPACGSDDDSDAQKSDEIAGADKDEAKPSSTPSPSKAPASRAPRFEFPKGVEVLIDSDETGDKQKDEVLREHGYSVKAIYLAFAKADPELALMQRYVWDRAAEVWRGNIAEYKKDGKSITGTIRVYDRSVRMQTKTMATVTYCMSDRDAYAKKISSGKTLRTRPSKDDFSQYTDRLEKKDGIWRVHKATSQMGVAACAR